MTPRMGNSVSTMSWPARTLSHAVCALLLVTCTERSAPTTRQLFDRIEIGMSRAEVDALLGTPVERYKRGPPPSEDEHAWYLLPPEIGLVEAPYAPGSIGVVFHPDGRVASKQINPQVR
jgi:hypothetical protein